jgi:hypothetical protein
MRSARPTTLLAMLFTAIPTLLAFPGCTPATEAPVASRLSIVQGHLQVAPAGVVLPTSIVLRVLATDRHSRHRRQLRTDSGSDGGDGHRVERRQSLAPVGSDERARGGHGALDPWPTERVADRDGYVGRRGADHDHCRRQLSDRRESGLGAVSRQA